MTDGLACKELVEIVTDYLEGRLSARDRLRFEEHLMACLGCTTYLEPDESGRTANCPICRATRTIA